MEEKARDYKPVHFNLFAPTRGLFKSKASDKSQIQVIDCCNSENCELHKNGMCALSTPIFSNRCQYGKRRTEHGYSRRAKTFYSWMSKQRVKYEGVPYLKPEKKNIYRVGDYILLPYSFMDMNKEVPFLSHGGGFSSGNSFLLASDFTITTIKSIVSFMPQAMMGGTIRDYQDKMVPLFLTHLKEKLPDLFDEFSLVAPMAIEKLSEFSNIGREALVVTLKAGCELTKRDEIWVWNGDKLTSGIYKPSFAIVDVDGCFIEITPKENATFKIQTEDQVCEDTVFIS